MNANEPGGKEASGTVDEQRAEWEGANYGMTVCANGVVNVENRNYGDDSGAHTYSVEVVDGAATGCSCPHATHRGAHCKHQRAVEARPLVVSTATAAGAAYAPVATDGGEELLDESESGDDVETCDDCGLSLVDAHEQPAGYVEDTTDGERVCGACSDLRHDRYRGERKTADELASGDETDGDRDTHGVVDPYADRVAEREAVDETPL